MQDANTFQLGDRPLDQLSKSDLSRCYAAVARRLAAAELLKFLIKGRLERRLREMEEAGKVTVSIPNPELHAGEREVQVVHASLEAAIKAAPDRGVNGIASALEDWDAARKWVEKHGLLEELGPVLRQFQEVVMERSKQLRDWRGGEPVEEDPLSTPPPPLEERPRRGERLTVGADLVLEMCTRQLSGENKLKDRVDAYIGHVPEMTDAWVQGFVESHMS